MILSKSRSWVKANIGVVPLYSHCNPYKVPIVLRIGPYRVPFGITIGIQRHNPRFAFTHDRDLLKIKFFHPDFFSSHRTTFLLHKKRAESPEPAGKPWNPFSLLCGLACRASCSHPCHARRTASGHESAHGRDPGISVFCTPRSTICSPRF